MYLTCRCIYKGYPLSGTDLDSLSLMLVQNRTADFPLWHFILMDRGRKDWGMCPHLTQLHNPWTVPLVILL